MQVARLTFAAQRSFRPAIFEFPPLTIYEAKFREKTHKEFSVPIWARPDQA